MRQTHQDNMLNRPSKVFMVACLFTVSLCVIAEPDTRKSNRNHERPKFSTLDLNGDGLIILDEFKQTPLRKREVTHERIFGHIDADGNGEISQEEFLNHKPPRRHKKRSS